MQNNTVETLIGAIVVAVAVGFLYFAYSSTNATSLSGYEVAAKFQRVDGLNVGTDVRLSGIKIGNVTALTLDPKTYQATVHLSIRDDVKLPRRFLDHGDVDRPARKLLSLGVARRQRHDDPSGRGDPEHAGLRRSDEPDRPLRLRRRRIEAPQSAPAPGAHP